MLHEEILPVSESFPDLVAFVDGLDGEGRDVLDSRDGQGAALQQELDHLVALAQQSIIQGSVPEAGRVCKVLECNSRHSYTGKLALRAGEEKVVLGCGTFLRQSSRASLWGCSFSSPRGTKQGRHWGQVLCAVSIPEFCSLAHKLGTVRT